VGGGGGVGGKKTQQREHWFGVRIGKKKQKVEIHEPWGQPVKTAQNQHNGWSYSGPHAWGRGGGKNFVSVLMPEAGNGFKSDVHPSEVIS